MTPLYRQWLAALRRYLGKIPGYELKRAGMLGDGGSFEDWAFWENQTLSFCLEMSHAERFKVKQISLGNGSKLERHDTFLEYEAFIYRMFDEALSIHPRSRPLAEDKLVIKPKEKLPASLLEQVH